MDLFVVMSMSAASLASNLGWDAAEYAYRDTDLHVCPGRPISDRWREFVDRRSGATETGEVTRREHWEKVYREKDAHEVSWFQRVPEISLSLVEAAGVGPEARVIDIGGGTSCFVDHLLDRGFRNLVVLDISRSALEESQRRLAERAGQVTWVDLDITAGAPGGSFDLWHDRAVFHFLTGPDQRQAYVTAMSAALTPSGHAIVATFAEDGPRRCSGLDVVRYSPAALQAALGAGLELVSSRNEAHRTPGGKEQAFVYCLFRRA